MSKAIGIMLTVCGLILAVWFVQMTLIPGPTPLPNFVVAAMAVAMISVGLRYILKSKKKTKATVENPAKNPARTSRDKS